MMPFHRAHGPDIAAAHRPGRLLTPHRGPGGPDVYGLAAQRGHVPLIARGFIPWRDFGVFARALSIP